MRKFISFILFICFIPFLTAQNHTVQVKGDMLCATTQSYSIEHGARLTLQAQPDSGYVFSQWADGNTDNPRVVLVESDITYEAHYAALPAEEEPTPATMHTVVVKGDELCATTQSYSMEHGSRLTLQAQPDSGYVFKQWSDGNTDNPRVVLVESDITYEAHYTALPAEEEPTPATIHTVVVKGDERCATTQSYSMEHGARLTLQAQPDSGYVFKQWADGNTDNPRVVTVESDITYEAHYTALPAEEEPTPATIHTVVVKGDELCATTQSYSMEHGARLTLQAQPDSGYVFKQWSDGNTDNPRVVTVDADATYEAHYAALPAEEEPTPATIHTVVVKGDERCATTQSYSIEHGARLTLQAQPDSGYVFKQWSDGNTDNPRVVTVDADATYEVHYAALPADDTPSDSDMVRCTIQAGDCATPFVQDFKKNTEVEIRAVPSECNRFVRWSDGNTDNPRTIRLSTSVTLIAEFVADQYTIRVESADESQGEVSISY